MHQHPENVNPTVIAGAKLAGHFHAPILERNDAVLGTWGSPTLVRSVNSAEAMASVTTSFKRGAWA